MNASRASPGARVGLEEVGSSLAPLNTFAPSRATLAGLMSCVAAGSLSMGLVPFIVSGLSRYAALGSSDAGLCVSSEMAGEVAGAAYMLLLMTHLPLRRVTVTALVLVIAGNLLCLGAGGLPAFAAARFVAGIGCGMTLAAYGPIAATRVPERNFAILNCANILLAAACGAAVPWLFWAGGVKALFLVIAVAAVGALLATAGISRRATFIPSELPPGEANRGSQTSAALFASLMNFFYFTALGAFWAYVSEIGVALGEDARFADTALAVGYLIAGIAGSAVAGAVASRASAKLVVCVGALGASAAVVTTILVPGPFVFAMTVSAFIFLWFLVYPFSMGILSALDGSGRLVVWNVLIQLSGFVVGPAIGGLVVRGHRYGAFGALCVIGFMAALACALAIRTSSSAAQKKAHH